MHRAGPDPSAVAAVFWGAILYPAVAVAGVLGSAVLARWLQPSLFGALVWLLAAVQTLVALSDLGTSLLLQQQSRFSSALLRLIAIRLVLLLALAGVAPLVGLVGPIEPSITLFVAFPTLALTQALAGMAQLRLSAKLDAVALRALGVTSSLLLPLLVVALTFGAPTFERLLLAAALASIFEAVLALGLAVGRDRPRLTVDVMRESMSLAGFYYADKVGKIAGGPLGALFLHGIFQRGPVLGAVGVTVDLGSRLEALSFGAVGGLLLPLVSRTSSRRGTAGEADAFRDISRFLLMAFAPAMVFAALAMPDLLPLLYGGEYVEAVPAAQVLVVAQAITGSLVPPAWTVGVTGRHYAPVLLTRALSVVLLLTLVAPLAGSSLGVSVAVAVAMIVPGAILHILTARRYRPAAHWTLLGRIAISLFASTAGALVVAQLVTGWRGKVLAAIVYVTFLAVALRVSRAFRDEDRAVIRAIPWGIGRPIERMLLSERNDSREAPHDGRT